MDEHEYDEEDFPRRNLIGDDDDDSEEEEEEEEYNGESGADEQDEEEDEDDDSPMEVKTKRQDDNRHDEEEETEAPHQRNKRKRTTRKEMPDLETLELAKLAREAREMDQGKGVIAFEDSDDEGESEEEAATKSSVKRVKASQLDQFTPESSSALDFARNGGLLGSSKRISLAQFRSRKLKGKPALQFKVL